MIKLINRKIIIKNVAGEFLARIEDLLLVAHLYIFCSYFFFSSLQGSNVSVWPCTPIWVFWNRRIGHTHTHAQARFLFLSSERKILRTRFGNWLALSTRRIYRIQLMVALIVYGMVFSHCILMEPHAPNTYLIETLHLLCPGICF